MIDPEEAVERLDQRFDELARISRPGPGVTRLAYSVLEREAHALVAGWAANEGASVCGDAAGNTIATYTEGEPCLLIGSHLDTVRHGGRYDGALGVLVALEVAARVRAVSDVPVRVVAFAGEEGARFGKPNLGSALAVGAFDPALLENLRDADGTSLGDAADAVGLHPAECRPWLTNSSVLAFLEPHIEQGRVLEARKLRIGVVDAIAGSVRIEFVIEGRAEHSGTTPMDLRRDALAAASEVVLGAEEAARARRDAVCTVGRIDVCPNSVTTIPGRVAFIADVRATDPDEQRRLAEDVVARFDATCARRRLYGRHGVLSAHDPIVLSVWPRLALAAAARSLQIQYRAMASGAGHDAAIVARVAPTAMLFVPCEGGRSHVPDEAASAEDAVLAAEVCTRALLQLAREAGPRAAAFAPVADKASE